MKKIKIAIVGMGSIFEKHYQLLKKNKFFNIIAVCDQNYSYKKKNS